MSRPWIRCLGTISLALCLGSVAAVPAASASRDEAPTPAVVAPMVAATSGNEEGFAELGACLAAGKRLEALYVVDVSGSLAKTDPDGTRFEALQASVVELGDLARESDGALSVDAAVATFGNDYAPPAAVADWVGVTGDNSTEVAAQLRLAAEQAWSVAGPQNQATHYDAAITGARKSLLARGSGKGTCRLMLWFTDGLFDLGTAQRTDEASRQMCAAGGVIDQIRHDSISVFALALFNPAVEAALRQPDNAGRRGELQAMATGRAPHRTCGTVPLPEGYRHGAYLSVADSGALRALFSAALAQGSGGAPAVVTAANPLLVEIAPGVRSFQADLTLAAATGPVVVTPPGGSSVTVPTDATAAGTPQGTVSARQFGTFVVVSVAMPGAGTPGVWRIQTTTDVTAAQVFLFSGLEVTYDTTTPLQAGQAGTVVGTLVDGAGDPADVSVYRDISSTATSSALGESPTRAPVRITDPATGRFEVAVNPAEDQTALAVSTTFIPRTARGTALAAVSRSQVINVRLSPAFPSVAPADALVIPTLDGTAPSSASLRLTGSSEGPTQVCLSAAREVEYPDRAEHVEVSADPSGCIDLAVGESKDVIVTVAPQQSADGAGSATLPLVLRSAPRGGQPAQQAQQDLLVEWDMTRPVDQGVRIWLLLLMTVIAAALPLLALYLVNRFLARFEGGDARVAHVLVDLDEGGPVRRDGGGPLLTSTDMRGCYISEDKPRELPEEIGRSLFRGEARMPRSPFAGPVFEAVAAPGIRLVAGERGDVEHDGTRAPLTAGLGTVWIMAAADSDLRASDDGPVPATLIVITRSYGLDLMQQVEDRVRHHVHWDTTLAALRACARAAEPVRQPAAVGALGGSDPGMPGPTLADPGAGSSGPLRDPFGGTTRPDQAPPAPPATPGPSPQLPRLTPRDDDFPDPFSFDR